MLPYGLALPGVAVDTIQAADLRSIRRMTMIENKSTYDAYLLSEREEQELAVCLGGFLSPQQERLFRKLKEGLPAGAEVCFWADVDLCGFRMFSRLQQIFPRLRPMRMSAAEVETYHAQGMARTEKYLARLKAAMEREEFPMFQEAAETILQYGVTIAQEVFLG